MADEQDDEWGNDTKNGREAKGILNDNTYKVKVNTVTVVSSTWFYTLILWRRWLHPFDGTGTIGGGGGGRSYSENIMRIYIGYWLLRDAGGGLVVVIFALSLALAFLFFLTFSFIWFSLPLDLGYVPAVPPVPTPLLILRRQISLSKVNWLLVLLKHEGRYNVAPFVCLSP